MQPNICAIQKVKGDMAQPQPSRREPEAPPRRRDLPPEILEIIGPALQVGGLSGMCFNLIPSSLRTSTPNRPYCRWLKLLARDCTSWKLHTNFHLKEYLEH
jgi:hypothetical protein